MIERVTTNIENSPFYDNARSRLDEDPTLTGEQFVEEILNETRLLLHTMGRTERFYTAKYAYETIGSTPIALDTIYTDTHDAFLDRLPDTPLFGFVCNALREQFDLTQFLLEIAYKARRAFRLAFLHVHENDSDTALIVDEDGGTAMGNRLGPLFIRDQFTLLAPFTDETIVEWFDGEHLVMEVVVPNHPAYEGEHDQSIDESPVNQDSPQPILN